MRFALLFLLGVGWAEAETPPPVPDTQAKLGTIYIREQDHSVLKRSEILKTEVISKKQIEHKRAQTLADAVSNQAGIDTQNSCANCGSKRVTVNGLRGEHTTILIDGVPMHSAVSSFYGLDAVPVVGIESIEVSRGSGASLIAPEAIGGVVNIITAKPKETGITIDSALGNAATGLFSILGSAVGSEGKHRLVLAGQLSNQGHWDTDGNFVSEAPDLSNRSFFIKTLSDFTPTDKLEARFARQTVGILGGTTNGTRPTTYVTTGPPTFLDDDVAKRYTGTQDLLTDVVDLTRYEAMARYTRQMPGDAQLQFTVAAADQRQNSIYMHGYDYSNHDMLAFADLRAVFPIGDSLFFTLGAENKAQDMDSESDKLYNVSALARDSFRYRSQSLYLQSVLTPAAGWELSAAVRADRLRVNWIAQTAREFEIDETLLAPRLHLKVDHSPKWTSRLMYGRGYRPPLSFFESQHGLNENGFVVEITELEKSHSLGYSLAYAKPGLSLTGSVHGTWLYAMAFADGNVTFGQPAIFRNFIGESQIWAKDLVLSYDLMPDWNMQLSYEHFSFPEQYSQRLPAAAVEQRIRMVSDWHIGQWEFVNTLTWIGARDLNRYGYNQHYRTLTTQFIDPLDPGLGTVPVVYEGKGTFAPPFLVWDLYLGWTSKSGISFFGSVQNVLNYTQTGYGDSPLNWSTHGNDPTHFHLDNNHTWGPIRGRTISVGLKAQL